MKYSGHRDRQRPWIVAPLAGAWIEIPSHSVQLSARRVAPLAGAWIEITNATKRDISLHRVAPLAGAWIEIYTSNENMSVEFKSHPSRVRGLKYTITPPYKGLTKVAPLAGAWIEISSNDTLRCQRFLSHPSRVRGLKCKTALLQVNI